MLVKLLGGRYQVSQILTAGECNTTYLAQDILITNQPTTLIQQLIPISTDLNTWERAKHLFQEQARIQHKLSNHPQIATLLDYFEQDQNIYLVYQLIDGHTLTQELRPSDKWQEKEVIELLQEVLSILSFVHDHGTYHGDLKPDNLIRRNSDQKLVLVNFASVKQVRTRLTSSQKKVRAATAVGIPGYLASEQVRGHPRPQSDIYGLGIIAIQALTGLSPLEFVEDLSTKEILWQHLVPVSKELANILSKMVRYHFRDRYQSAAEVLQALEMLKVNHSFGEQIKVHKFKAAKKADNYSNSLPLKYPDSPLETDRITDVPAENYTQSATHFSKSSFEKDRLLLKIVMPVIVTTLFSTVYLLSRYWLKAPSTETTVNKRVAETSQVTCMVIGPGWNIRSQPRGGSVNNILQAVPQGTVLSMTGNQKDGWLETSSPIKGWVFHDRGNLECSSD